MIIIIIMHKQICILLLLTCCLPALSSFILSIYSNKECVAYCDKVINMSVCINMSNLFSMLIFFYICFTKHNYNCMWMCVLFVFLVGWLMWNSILIYMFVGFYDKFNDGNSQILFIHNWFNITYFIATFFTFVYFVFLFQKNNYTINNEILENLL